jgi:hypothetical protein
VDVRWDAEDLEGLRERIQREDLLKMGMLGDVRPWVG